ncbi:MAG TPA: hypothetical protein VKS25_02295 [Solirubrobacteraceae bacterium]|nr:hypothetical protein [Solirubrobacteraceae bacterium]
MGRAGAEITFDPTTVTAANASVAVIDGATSLNAITCTSATACVAVDSAQQEISFDPASPGNAKAAVIDTSNHVLQAIACPASDQCTAVDDVGALITFDPASPSSATTTWTVSTSYTSISCPGVHVCVAGDGAINGVVSFDPTAADVAATEVGVGLPSAVLAVSCVSASVCTAVDSRGGEATFAPFSHAVTTVPVEAAAQLNSLVCLSAAECVAVDTAGQRLVFDPGTMTPPASFAFPGPASSIACPSATQCTAAGELGSGEVTFNPLSPPSDPVPIDVGNDQSLYAIVCPTVMQCTAADAAGAEVTFDPETATATSQSPVLLDAGNTDQSAGLACPSSSQCTLVDDKGQEVTFDPQTATPTSQSVVDIDGSNTLINVACPAANQCTAIDSAANELTFDPLSPQSVTTVRIDGNVAMTDISCPETTECVATDYNGAAIVFDPQTASRAAHRRAISRAGVGGLSAIVCPSSSQCTASNQYGLAVTFDPSASDPATTANDAGLSTLSLNRLACASATQCTVLVASGSSFPRELTFDPQTTSSPEPAAIDNGVGLEAVACPSTASCSAVDAAGREVSFAPLDLSSGQTETPDDSNAGPLLAVACNAPGECAGVGIGGEDVDFDSSSIAAPSAVAIDGTDPLHGLACLSATQCVAVGGLFGGDEIGFDFPTGAAFEGATIDPGHTLLAVSCPIATQCTSVDDGGNEVTFNPASVGHPVVIAIDPGQTLHSVACPWLTQCTAVDGAGDEVTFDPTATVNISVVDVDDGNSLSSLACPSLIECTAVGEHGIAVTFDPQTGSVEPPLDIDGVETLNAITCTSAALCVAVDELGRVVVATGPSAPSATAPPTIAGMPSVGQILTVSHGSWSITPTAYAYQWEYCDSSGDNCHAIAGATGQTYSTTSADRGSTIAVLEVGIAGDTPGAPVISGVTDVIAGPPGSPTPGSGGGANTGPAESGGGASQGAHAPSGGAASAGVLPPDAVLLKTTLRSRGRRATFKFTANGDASGYVCALVRLPRRKHAKVPQARFSACGSPKTYRQLTPGSYFFELRAEGPGGAQSAPITHRFTIG